MDGTPEPTEALTENEWWISVEMLTDPDYYLQSRTRAGDASPVGGRTMRPWMRVTLWNHPLDHPDCRALDYRDVRSANGRDKAVADFTARMEAN